MGKSIFFIFIMLLVACSPRSQQMSSLKGSALGTTYTIQYLASDLEQNKIKPGLDSLFTVINASMSTYIASSTLSKINKGDSLVIVDQHFKKVFNLSDKIWNVTSGYFDPTVGRLVNAYGFGPEKREESLSVTERDSLLQITGWDKITLTPTGQVRKTHPFIYIDFNAIAKGYTVDVISDYLATLGSQNHLVEIGGEIRVKGLNPVSAKPWRIGIDRPVIGQRKIQAVAQLSQGAMATSGNYRKYRIDSLTGKKYVHSINPKNGLPVRSSILSVSVKAPSCAMADAFATALMVMPFDQGKEIVAADQQLEAYWILAGQDGQFKEISSRGWE